MVLPMERRQIQLRIMASTSISAAEIANPASTIGAQMPRDSASPEKKADRMTSIPSGLADSTMLADAVIQGHRVLIRMRRPRQPSRSGKQRHTIIITGFSISCLKAPISSAPSAPSMAR
ncbi:hypothetical protein [Bradyrhizobium sp. HKCCYLS20291]|uniref:hypothetical protein n=1 Tax=Bradyrhizobium sp. HKCCYLS20291 TaxID=3420766 RepID=UPI003EC02FC9